MGSLERPLVSNADSFIERFAFGMEPERRLVHQALARKIQSARPICAGKKRMLNRGVRKGLQQSR